MIIVLLVLLTHFVVLFLSYPRWVPTPVHLVFPMRWDRSRTHEQCVPKMPERLHAYFSLSFPHRRNCRPTLLCLKLYCASLWECQGESSQVIVSEGKESYGPWITSLPDLPHTCDWRETANFFEIFHWAHWWVQNTGITWNAVFSVCSQRCPF